MKDMIDKQAKAREEMTRYINRFRDRFPPKFFRGQKEHGNNLADVTPVTLGVCIEDKILDSWAYLQELRERVYEWSLINVELTKAKQLIGELRDLKFTQPGDTVSQDLCSAIEALVELLEEPDET